MNVLALTEGRKLLAMGKSQDWTVFFFFSSVVALEPLRKTNSKFQ